MSGARSVLQLVPYVCSLHHPRSFFTGGSEDQGALDNAVLSRCNRQAAPRAAAASAPDLDGVVLVTRPVQRRPLARLSHSDDSVEVDVAELHLAILDQQLQEEEPYHRRNLRRRRHDVALISIRVERSEARDGQVRCGERARGRGRE